MFSSSYLVDKCYSHGPHAMQYGVKMVELARPKQNTLEELSIAWGQQRCCCAHVSEQDSPKIFLAK